MHNGEKSATHGDTPQRIMRTLVARARAMTEAQRLLLAARFSSDLMKLSLDGIRRANPQLNDRDAQLLFVGLHHGHQLADRLRRRWSNDGLRGH